MPTLANHKSRFGWPLITMGLGGLVAIPILVVLTWLFLPGGETWDHLKTTTLFPMIWTTGQLMVLVAIFSTLLGVSTAWLVSATDFPLRRLFAWALVLPLAAPAYVIAYLYTDLLDYNGPVQMSLRSLFGWSTANQYWFPQIRSLPGAAIMLSLVLYPYIYLLSRAAFGASAGQHFEAARSLGSTPWQAFLATALPAARPAIAGGLALVLMETLADYGVVEYFAIQTFSTGIFRVWFAMGDQAAALKLAGVMFLFVVALVTMEAASRRGKISSEISNNKMARLPLTGVKATAAIIICALPVVFGCLIPLARLGYLSIQSGDQLWGNNFLQFAYNSISVALIAAAVACIIALILAYASRLSPSPITKGAIRLSTLGYALPGALLAVGLLAPFSSVDRSLTLFLRDQLGWQGGLILTGTVIMLVYAYLIRFLTVAYNSIRSGLTIISSSMDAAARSLGATPFDVVKKIHLPLIRPSLIAAGLLVFVDVMRELPATLILRPSNFETLATRVYRLASDERLAEASTAALVIILVGLIPTFLLGRSKQ